jgi:hypothetical protein
VYPDSLPLLRDNQALPKPQFAKMKIINRYDTLLKPEPKGKEGAVGYFDPAPNDTTLTLRIGPQDCPYLNLPGEHLIARIHEGQLWYGR